MRKIMSSTVRRLKDGIRPGVPKDTKLLARDVFAVKPDEPEQGTVEDEKLRCYGLQRGPMGLPEVYGKVRRLTARENRVEERLAETPITQRDDPQVQPSGVQNQQYSTDKQPTVDGFYNVPLKSYNPAGFMTRNFKFHLILQHSALPRSEKVMIQQMHI